ncbi:hypothetical protein LCGC14_1803600 [marine sediment metagenome]|uniref:Uncharacterized protein n=1 Tax=marine sediment metagenome TaxID=412755 RepID=A0A0F9J3K4_9ZZZZ
MTSVIERIDTDFKIPFDARISSKNPEIQAEYMLELAETLQLLLEKIITVANFSIDLFDGEAVYYALKNSDGVYPEGTWRRIQVGDNLEDQVLLDGDSISGTWTFVQRRERPI